MLVLSRKLGETVVIDNEVIVKIIRIEGKRVVLGVQAPLEIRVRRGELCENATGPDESAMK